jgi:hypothetical protein
MKLISFLARHLIAVALAAVVACALWTITYIGLFAWAMITNGGIGGPLAYPAGLLFVFVSCLIVGFGIFAPACGFGLVLTTCLRLPRLAAIPFVFLAAVLLSYLAYYGFIELLTTHSMPPIWTVCSNFVIYLSIPLGIYWWLTDGPGAIIDLIRRRFSARPAN